MPFKFNPFTGNFDQTGSGGGGGGSSYIDGEVQNFSALPETLGSPAVDSAYLVREAEGAWLLNRKPAGIYIRTANTGTRASDWTYAGEFPDVFSDANFVLYDNGDSTKNLQFQLSGITTATTRTLTVPNASGTIQLTGHAAEHAAGGSDPLFDQDLNTTDSVFFNELETDNNLTVNGDITVINALNVGDSGIYFDQNGASNTRTNLGLGTAATAATGDFATASHSHGNINSSGQVGSDSGRVLVTTTAGAVTTLALGTAGQVLTVNSGATGVEFAAASGGGVTGAAASASDVLGVSGANITGVDANADRIIFFDDSAGKLTHLTLGSNALSIDGTTLKSQPLFPVEPISRGATYIPYIGAASNGNSSSAVNSGSGFVLFSPVYVRKSANYTTFSAIVNTAGSASSLGKMALYTIKAADATPDALVCQSGTFTTDSTGIKQPTMASTFVSEGWYYMAIGTNSTTNVVFYGDTMALLRGVFSGAAFNVAAVLLDYSQKLYADLWPNPWNGTATTFRNAFHPITSLT